MNLYHGLEGCTETSRVLPLDNLMICKLTTSIHLTKNKINPYFLNQQSHSYNLIIIKNLYWVLAITNGVSASLIEQSLF